MALACDPFDAGALLYPQVVMDGVNSAAEDMDKMLDLTRPEKESDNSS